MVFVLDDLGGPNNKEKKVKKSGELRKMICSEHKFDPKFQRESFKKRFLTKEDIELWSSFCVEDSSFFPDEKEDWRGPKVSLRQLYYPFYGSSKVVFPWVKKKKVINSFIKEEIGFVVTIADGIVIIKGLNKIGYGELIKIYSDNDIIRGTVLNIEKYQISAALFSNDNKVKPGQQVRRDNKLVGLTIGDDLLGRIINPLGEVLDGFGEIGKGNYVREKKYLPIEAAAPPIISRKSVNVPLETGLKVIDSLVPIGHGQRELIIGDTKTGKTSIALDTILNQKNTDTICIYVAIGQKRSSVIRIANLLRKKDCLNFSIIVAATASDTAALQYIAPYSGCTIGEYFMKKGMRVLIVYDDLSKHAVSYRQLSLLLRRPPGREGYPGDVFFLHSRLLERAASLNTNGSITALPIIETIQGDVSAYIPTNVISITDGQIFLDAELFFRGIRPSVSPGLSVSRVGSAAQNKTLKKLAGDLKLELAQYREVEGFTKLGFSLDDATKQLIDRGSLLTRMLVQKRFQPIKIYKQILFLYAGLFGYLDNIPLNHLDFYEENLYKFLDNSYYSLPMKLILPEDLNKDLLNSFLSLYTKWYTGFLTLDLSWEKDPIGSKTIKKEIKKNVTSR